MRALALAALAVAAPLALPSAPAHAQVIAPVKPFDPAVARVVGRSELQLPPDQARVGLQFYSPGRTAAEATEAVSRRARALEAAVRAIDGDKARFERTDFTVSPVMRPGGDRRPDRINGYEARAQVTILVTDLTLLSKVVEAVVNGQPDTFDDVQFSIRDPAAARRQARQAAVADAVDKARIYVEGAGFRLGRLLLVEEGGSNIIAQSGNRMRFAARVDSVAAEAAPVAAPSIAPENQLFTAEVTLVFEIGAGAAPTGR